MRHLKWISALDLNRWADTNDAKTRLPELIRRLVHGTIEASNLEHVNFPSGEETHRPGYDGETKTKLGNAKVPDGVAYWELGANQEVKKKFEEDYAKRLEGREAGDFSKVTYIAVSPRDFQNKKDWVAEKNKSSNWREVRAYDSDDLEQWLEMAPGVSLWLSKYAAKQPDGLVDLSTHWENLRASLKRHLPNTALLVGREDVAQIFNEWLKGSPQVLTLRSESPQEVVDVFAAWVESLSENDQSAIASRAVIVEQVAAWHELAESEQRLILIRSEKLELTQELVAEAIRKGHHVLLPTSSLYINNVPRLNRLNTSELEKILIGAGLSEQEAHSLAHQSGGSFTIFKRRYSAIQSVKVPKWGEAQAAAELAPLLLAGAWQDKSVPDQNITVKISGSPYANILKLLNRWRTEGDTPVRWNNGVWEFVSPQDAWVFLAQAITPAQLDAFEAAACEVLGADNPKYELPIEQRWQAQVHGKKLEHSDEIRSALVRTLALIATRNEATLLADTASLQTRVDRVVRSILSDGVHWQRWASLGHSLAELAEAAPTVFLEAVESDLRSQDSELVKLYAQEKGGGIGGQIEHTGLLWALERLAWSSQFLPRVAITLAKLAERDPGGQWVNRPSASLHDIFCSWLPHTTAPLDKRMEIISTLLKRHPQVGWKLLLDLLPSGSGGAISYRYTPEWRQWAEEWTRGTTQAELFQTNQLLKHLAISAASEMPERWFDLIKHFRQFSREEFELAITALESVPDKHSSSELTNKLWKTLRDEVQRHRYFSDAQWALPKEAVDRLEGTCQKLEPQNGIDLAVPLFERGFGHFGNKSLSWEQQQSLQAEAQKKLVQKILADQGIDGILRLVKRVENPSALGCALADASGDQFQEKILPSMLCAQDKLSKEFANAYAANRIYLAGREWAENISMSGWTTDESAAFLSWMPFDMRTWNHMEKQAKSIEAEYWRRTRHLARGFSAKEIEYAARKFISVGRFFSGMELLEFHLTNEKGSLENTLLIELLEAGLDPSVPIINDAGSMGSYTLEQLIGRVQEDPQIDKAKLAKIEWQLLPILGRHTRQPITLYAVLSSDPKFFIDVLTVLFVPRHSDKQKRKNEAEDDENTKLKAEHAWKLLHDWNRVPGTRDNGSVDADQLKTWVKVAREMATTIDRREVCDVTIGGVLAYSPIDGDEAWPCVAVRDIFEEVDSPEMERGFLTGVINKRGAYHKSLTEGGRQERELANQFKANAEKCQTAFSGPCRSAFRAHVDHRSGLMSIAVPEHVDHSRMSFPG